MHVWEEMEHCVKTRCVQDPKACVLAWFPSRLSRTHAHADAHTKHTHTHTYTCTRVHMHTRRQKYFPPLCPCDVGVLWRGEKAGMLTKSAVILLPCLHDVVQQQPLYIVGN